MPAPTNRLAVPLLAVLLAVGPLVLPASATGEREAAARLRTAERSLRLAAARLEQAREAVRMLERTRFSHGGELRAATARALLAAETHLGRATDDAGAARRRVAEAHRDLRTARRHGTEPRGLALLGPSRGRTCATPPGLRETDRRVIGLASWYGPGFAGNLTANGDVFDPHLFTAAHKTLPLGVFLKVHRHGRCAIVLVNDRGPYVAGRVIDLSAAAARYLGVGVSRVRAEVLVPKR